MENLEESTSDKMHPSFISKLLPTNIKFDSPIKTPLKSVVPNFSKNPRCLSRSEKMLLNLYSSSLSSSLNTSVKNPVTRTNKSDISYLNLLSTTGRRNFCSKSTATVPFSLSSNLYEKPESINTDLVSSFNTTENSFSNNSTISQHTSEIRDTSNENLNSTKNSLEQDSQNLELVQSPRIKSTTTVPLVNDSKLTAAISTPNTSSGTLLESSFSNSSEPGSIALNSCFNEKSDHNYDSTKNSFIYNSTVLEFIPETTLNAINDLCISSKKNFLKQTQTVELDQNPLTISTIKVPSFASSSPLNTSVKNKVTRKNKSDISNLSPLSATGRRNFCSQATAAVPFSLGSNLYEKPESINKDLVSSFNTTGNSFSNNSTLSEHTSEIKDTSNDNLNSTKSSHKQDSQNSELVQSPRIKSTKTVPFIHVSKLPATITTPNTSSKKVPESSFSNNSELGSISLSSCLNEKSGYTYESTENSSIINTTVSEYFPETSLDTRNDLSISSKTNYLEQSQTVKIVQDPLTISTINVPQSNALKKHFCVFCKTLQTKISRHFFLRHKSEKEVQEASRMPIKSIERLKIIEKLRKEGDFVHNTSAEHNTGILIVSRQQLLNRRNTAEDYVCCKVCKGFFSKNTLRLHMVKCDKNRKKNVRHELASSRRLTQYAHKAANFTLKTKIFPLLRNDDVGKAVRYDELIVKFGNRLTEKYTLRHQEELIRSELRLLARFLIDAKLLSINIKQLKDIFKPELFDICIEALRKTAKWDDSLKWFKTPAVAQHLATLIKKCAKIQKLEYIKSSSEGDIKQLQYFVDLWDEDIQLINKKALTDQSTQKRLKKFVLPSTDDIKKLNLFLKYNMYECISVLEKKFCNKSWNNLVKATLAFVQIFNRRRAGEIERLTIASYNNKGLITEQIEGEILKNMSTEAVAFSKQFVHLTLRGKLNRTVSVILDPLSIKAIELIIKHRTTAGIPQSNEYVFAKKQTSKFSTPYYRACPLLREFSVECGADIPHSIRGTTLRKHIATITALQNLEESTVDTLANFMGHHKDIHKSIYRVPVPVAEIMNLSKILMSAVGEDVEEQDKELQHNEYIEESDENEEKDEQPSTSQAQQDLDQNLSSKKRRSTSPFGKTRRVKWTDEEKEAIYSYFGQLKELERLPSLMQCLDAIKANKALKARTPTQVKTWIDNQRRYK